MSLRINGHTTDIPTASSAVFPGKKIGPDAPDTASDAELTALFQTMGLHAWTAPDHEGRVWQPVGSRLGSVRTSLNKILEKTGMYDVTQKRWNLGPTLEGRGLVEGFERLLTQLFRYNGKMIRVPVSRDLNHISDFNALNKSSPLLSICEWTRTNKRCIVPIEVRPESDYSSQNGALMVQVALYAHRCFIQQPERGSICCFVLTTSSLHVYRFDRDGFYSTYSLHDIHKDPLTFMHVIFTFSQREIILDNIFLDRHHVGWMRFTVPNNRTLDLQVEKNVYVHPSFCGRATTCWKVKDPLTGQCFLVKRTWDLVEVDGESEAALLTSAKGLPHVAQVVAFTERTVIGFAGSQPRAVPGETTNVEGYQQMKFPRIHRQLVLEYYERAVHKFQSRMELLYIVRDAVEGHRNLWLVGICHRDICPKNIRIRPCDNLPNTEGTQGILIGLDKAKRVGRPTIPLPCTRDSVGKTAFQSMFVLTAARNHQYIFPAYVDDLESFFYILCHCCSAYKQRADLTESAGEDLRRMFTTWNSPDPQVSLAAKLVFCAKPIPEGFVAPYFGNIFTEMLENMRKFVHSLTTGRLGLSTQDSHINTSEPPSLTGYSNFLAFINCAISEINVGVSRGLPK